VGEDILAQGRLIHTVMLMGCNTRMTMPFPFIVAPLMAGKILQTDFAM